jgi:hypothetical protein
MLKKATQVSISQTATCLYKFGPKKEQCVLPSFVLNFIRNNGPPFFHNEPEFCLKEHCFSDFYKVDTNYLNFTQKIKIHQLCSVEKVLQFCPKEQLTGIRFFPK